MKKLYFLAILALVSITINAQEVVKSIDLTTIDGAYTTTFEDELVLDLATCTSAIADPAVGMANPFMSETFATAQISFDIYNYLGVDSIKVLGATFGIGNYTADPQERLYFSNGCYMGYNVGNDNWCDANLISYGLGKDFLGGQQWKNVKILFTETGYALYVDDGLAYDQNSTDVTITAGANFDAATIIPFLKSAPTLAFGTGSWWSDNTRDDGSYWDAQFSYIKNINFILNPDAVGIEKQRFIDTQTKVVQVDYFTITGSRIAVRFEDLEPGLYIKRSLLDNGEFRSEKIMKLNKYR